ncbi:asparagine synthetase domain-containing protein 1-like [Saccostrea echinata]|uniref:asparagine synthetase domain-containing protein 1-like n=1 Tax=Saccostrea echinata TaxID=191078 RepID=UPI002A800E18|nr:asparagine synthetase domain-containing protein 1-like [Saccostrea echinata]
MCGICCVLLRGENHDCTSSCLRLKNRGPDASSQTVATIDSQTRLVFTGHVLHMRGPLTPQPTTDKRGNCLLWNGEIFGGLQITEEKNDTAVLLEILSEKTDVQHILGTLSKIHGPWAFVYWQEEKKRLWFGRDFFGRRSLCWHLPRRKNDAFILSSVRQNTEDLQEVPSVGIYSVDLMHTEWLNMTLYSWASAVWPGTMDPVTSDNLLSGLVGDSDCDLKIDLHPDCHLTKNIPPLNKTLPDLDPSKVIIKDQESVIQTLLGETQFQACVDNLIHLLLHSVTVRVFNQVMLSHRENKHCVHATASNNSSDLQNVDESSSHKLKSDSLECFVSNELSNVRLHQVEGRMRIPAEGLHQEGGVVRGPTEGLHQEGGIVRGPAEGLHHEGGVVRGPAKVAVLFSGGVDSAVIAALVDKCLPAHEPVDLINVAFERIIPQKQSEDETWNVPDRQTGMMALQELNPHRKWNFIMVNVSIAELQKKRSEHIRHLVYPLETVLDDSIGCAVWFAARGEGILGNGEHAGMPYKSSAKVILCGMGADEQFAGYSRHRGKFEELGWQGLTEEVEMEVQRISARNLGRDDRVVTDHGKEARFPFLDENVVSYLQSIPIQTKADLRYPRGLGEKILLRACAGKLGLIKSALFPKRAIQFGSRIAKTENNKEKASQKCPRLADPTCKSTTEKSTEETQHG